MKTASSTYHHGDLPNALMDAVEDIMARDGLHAVSLRAAARHVGVSHAAPAHHFGDLSGLLTAVAERAHQRFGAALEQACHAAADQGVEQRMMAIGQAYLDFAVANPAVFTVMFRADLVARSSDETGGPPARGFEVLTEQIAAGLGTDESDRPDVWRLAMMAWSGVHGAAMLWLQGTPTAMRPDVTLDQMFDLVGSGILAGLRADPAWVG